MMYEYCLRPESQRILCIGKGFHPLIAVYIPGSWPVVINGIMANKWMLYDNFRCPRDRKSWHHDSSLFLTTCGATSNDQVGILTTLCFPRMISALKDTFSSPLVPVELFHYKTLDPSPQWWLMTRFVIRQPHQYLICKHDLSRWHTPLSHIIIATLYLVTTL